MPYLKPISNPPNRMHLKAWAEHQNTPMLRQIAHKIIEHINHISFETFLSQLRVTVADFHEKTNGEPYVILIAEAQQDKVADGCSDTWVVELAREAAGLRRPEAILTQANCTAYFKGHPRYQHVLVLDDAAYSGTQKQRDMDSFFFLPYTDRLQIYMGLVYASAMAVEKMREFGLTLLKHGHIASIMDAFTRQERRYIQALDLGFLKQSITLTYFDHRYPDFMSTYLYVYSGINLLSTQTWMIMHDVLGYQAKAMDEDTWKTLTYALFPNMSDRVGYNIPKVMPPYGKQMDMDSSDAVSKLPYVHTSMTEEQQKAFDTYVFALHPASSFELCLESMENFFGVNTEDEELGGMAPSCVMS
jgi:hypothetical protein